VTAPAIIEVALNGVTSKDANSRVPRSPAEITADALEAKPNPLLQKFRWRPEIKSGETKEAARFAPDR